MDKVQSPVGAVVGSQHLEQLRSLDYFIFFNLKFLVRNLDRLILIGQLRTRDCMAALKPNPNLILCIYIYALEHCTHFMENFVGVYGVSVEMLTIDSFLLCCV
jgi:hypothetical protein